LGLEINYGIEEELPHYQFLFIGPKLNDLSPLGLVFRTDLGLAAYERRRSQRSSIHRRLSALELNSFSLYIRFCFN